MRRIFFFAVIIISFFIIYNLLVTIYTLWQKEKIISQIHNDFNNEQKKNKELTNKLIEAESGIFLENQARNKLFLVKQGESQIILPLVIMASIRNDKNMEIRPNWQKWLNLFIPFKE
ncbi:hypothetical protein LBMAG33_5090 [Candidatus Levyibacteriota bacterium]|nr:septum formation initiator family protein [Candidatus Levybacteria bacterium]GDX62199.1 hypothetical protein LBMAG33_5090 [Candidatus Levybacteria bacterium]